MNIQVNVLRRQTVKLLRRECVRVRISPGAPEQDEHAPMAELVDALDSKLSVERRPGSSPGGGTIIRDDRK